jgi:hypothetical protein
MPMYYTMHTIFKAHDIAGDCGKCRERFENQFAKEFFCNNCRSLPLHEWEEWMHQMNEEAKQCLKSS